MKRSIAALAATVLILAGCKFDLTTDLYVSDLRDMAANGYAGSFPRLPLTISVEVFSAPECEEYAAEIGRAIADMLRGFVSKGCRTTGMETTFTAEAQVPLARSLDAALVTAAANATASLLSIVITEDDRAVLAVLNHRAYRELERRLKETLFIDLWFGESTVTFVLHNDERQEAAFAATGVFVDGNPMPSGSTERHSLAPRRGRANIVLSDVGRSRLEKHGIAHVLQLTGPAT